MTKGDLARGGTKKMDSQQETKIFLTAYKISRASQEIDDIRAKLKDINNAAIRDEHYNEILMIISDLNHYLYFNLHTVK